MPSQESGKQGRRLSITKRQRELPAVVDLMNLCLTITEDGRLDDEEILALREWLEENEDLDLPAKEYLWHTVEKILADGRIDPDERRELFLAIEKVMPRDLRETVRSSRRTAEEAERARRREERAREEEQQRAERLRNSPLERWDFMVAGVRYEGRPEVIRRYAKTGQRVFLVRDARNPYSRNAVRVQIEGGHELGMVPEDDAVSLAPYLDKGHPYTAWVKKILTGGRVPIPVVVAEVYRHDATVAGLTLPGDRPTTPAGHPVHKVTRREGSREGTGRGSMPAGRPAAASHPAERAMAPRRRITLASIVIAVIAAAIALALLGAILGL